VTGGVFPAINATLNATSGILLCTGFLFIRAGKWRAHATMMISATVVSTVFLACYLTYHYLNGEHNTAASHAPHWLRTIYLFVLFPHLILAVAMLPMICLTLLRAYRRDWIRHRKIAVPTFWIWLYVSVTGVIVYFLLYHTTLAS
jgi:protein SCO1/2/putative membrane protein